MSQTNSPSPWTLPLWVILYCIALWLWALVAGAYALILITGLATVGDASARITWAVALAGGSLALLVSGVGVWLRRRWGVGLSGLLIALAFTYSLTLDLLKANIGGALVRLVIGLGLAAFLVYLLRALEPAPEAHPGEKGD